MVKRSAGFCKPGTFITFTDPSETRPWIHRYCTSIWRNLPRPSRETIPRAALASDRIMASTLIPRSLATLIMPSV